MLTALFNFAMKVIQFVVEGGTCTKRATPLLRQNRQRLHARQDTQSRRGYCQSIQSKVQESDVSRRHTIRVVLCVLHENAEELVKRKGRADGRFFRIKNA